MGMKTEKNEHNVAQSALRSALDVYFVQILLILTIFFTNCIYNIIGPAMVTA
jgi:hypothetical protein